MTEAHWTQLRDNSVLEECKTRLHRERLRPLTKNQERYFKAIETSALTVCTGPAGSGKTFSAIGIAAQMLRDGRISRVVLTRPLAECDEDPQTLPGDLWEKIQDMMSPMMDALEEFFTHQEIEKMRRENILQVIPLGKMRGRTFKGSLVILDEAQNATRRQLRMFLTRMGHGSKVVVCGDHTQSDLPYKGKNSLLNAIDRFSKNCHPSVSVVKLYREDIVRHPLIQWIEERLTGVESKHEQGKVGAPWTQSVDKYGWCPVTCPKCDKVSYVEHWALENDMFVSCFHCRQVLEVLDENGFIDPLAVNDDVAEYDARDVVPH